MAQSGYTPILIYASGTTGNTPSASNLTSSASGSELALNYFDGKLFYKDASGNVQVLASKAGNINVSSLSFGTTGLTPSTATTGAITVAGVLNAANGGTGEAGTLTGILYGNGTSSHTVATTAQVLSLIGTLPVSNGGTGQTTFTSGQVLYGNGTSGLSTSANMTFNGSTLTTLNLSYTGTLTGGTGAFTTLSASSTVSGAGFSNYFAAPPTIGNTTPNAGTFTALVTNGLSVNGVSLGAGDASIMKNRIINGAMVINQRGFNGAVTTSNTYTLDRWNSYTTQSSKFTVAQSSVAPVGFTNSLLVTSSSAYSVGASDYFNILQSIEGYNVADLGFGTANAKTVTLSFWVRSSLTGTFGGGFSNINQDRTYPFTYSIPVANTWTQISITITGDTTGTWNTTIGSGLYVYFGLGVGSTYSASAGSWQAGTYLSATGATSVVGTSGATFYITGVQLEVGSSATGFEYVNYQTSLANCQRYCYVNSYSGNAYTRIPLGVNGSTTSTVATFPLPVTMRTIPSFTWNGNFVETITGATGTSASITTDGNSLNSAACIFTYSSGLVVTNSLAAIRTNNSTTWQAIFSAEL